MTPDPLVPIIAAMARGDRGALLHFHAATAPLLHAVILRILPDRDEAEAALTATALAIFATAGHHAATGLSPRAWAVAIARQQAIDRRRTRPSAPVLADLSPEPDLPADLPVPLARRLAALDPDRAEALTRALVLAEDHATLAARFGMTVPRLRQWLRPALIADAATPDEALCAEHALGLLPPDEAQAFAARLATDPALRARTILWAEDMATLAAALPDPGPPPDVEPALRAGAPRPDGQGWLARLGLLPALVGALVAGLLVFGADRAGLLLPDPAATPAADPP